MQIDLPDNNGVKNMFIWRATIYCLFSVFAAFGLSTLATAGVGDWEAYPPMLSPGLDGVNAKATKWINETCKPDQIGDVTAFLSQNGHSTPYNIHIYCKFGNRKVNVEAAQFIYDQDKFVASDFIGNALAGRSVSIIGIFAGARNEIFYFRQK